MRLRPWAGDEEEDRWFRGHRGGLRGWRQGARGWQGRRAAGRQARACLNFDLLVPADERSGDRVPLSYDDPI
jgi:hypothetical protein